MPDFSGWGQRIGEVVNDLGKKTEDTIEVQKIKSEIRSLNRGNDRDYIDIGKTIMERYQSGEVIDGDMAALCEAIAARNERIKEYEENIERITSES